LVRTISFGVPKSTAISVNTTSLLQATTIMPHGLLVFLVVVTMTFAGATFSPAAEVVSGWAAPVKLACPLPRSALTPIWCWCPP
jgi:hypothetical protein